MTIQSMKVSIPSRDGKMIPAHLALPSRGNGPGIVLMQEIFGVNAYMREVAAWHAARGFVVICPDLFWRQEPGVELTDRTEAEWGRGVALMRGMDEALAVADCAAAVDFLRVLPACTGRVAGVGFCLGGRLAYLVAAGNHADACVGYYGVGIEGLLDRAKGMTTPLMLHIAGKDEYCKPTAQEAIRRALGGHEGVTLHTYPEHDHAFGRPGGKHYDAGAAELANLRTLDFFTKILAAAGPDLAALWEEHIRHEFATKDTEATLQTMVEHAYVNHVPVLTGGTGREALRDFYAKRFIPKMPADTTITPVSRTVGAGQLVDEMVFSFTHSIEMDWMLPGIKPTGRKVAVPLVVIVRFEGNRLAHEHIYWDQASVLAQIGLLDATKLPISGSESAARVLDTRGKTSS